MRLLEILLLSANLFTFFVLSASRLRAVRGTQYSALVAVGIVAVHALVEGPRWQMVPAYALTGLFFVIRLLQIITAAGKPAGRRWNKRFTAGLVVGLGVIGMAVSITLPMIVPVVTSQTQLDPMPSAR